MVLLKGAAWHVTQALLLRLVTYLFFRVINENDWGVEVLRGVASVLQTTALCVTLVERARLSYPLLLMRFLATASGIYEASACIASLSFLGIWLTSPALDMNIGGLRDR